MSLNLNFHKTFVPERSLLAALLDYAAQEKSGTYQEIAATTGIPMGKSSGKLPAILDYARGMGLVELESMRERSIRKPLLTAFGKIVLAEDPWLGRALTQWLVHLHLCLPKTGAIAWYKVFAEGRNLIGSSFSEGQLEDYLVKIFGPGRNRRGPLVRTYLDDAALGRAFVLARDKKVIRREKAPLLDEFAFGYAAFLLKILEDHFPDEFQVTVTDLNDRIYCFDTCLWEASEIDQALALVERTGFISIDRQMRPWILERKAASSQAWARIYHPVE